MISQQKFPKDFLWGASTASHQVEGGTVNQWSVWELANAADLAAGAEARLGWLPDWPDIKGQATNPDNYISGKGVDHYHRYEEDFDLLKKLQCNSFRFGVEWSRINPEEGVWNKEAIAHYHRYIDALRARGIEPILNIWHWTMPVWFTDKGGFEKRENLEYFDRFVRKIAEEYADKVDYVITLNEPNTYVGMSYQSGEWPPQKASPLLFAKVYRNLYQAHRRAYAILKERRSTLHIGVAMQLGNIQAKRPHNVFDGAVTMIMRYVWNWWFLNRIRRYQDFVGVNYYFTDYFKGMSFRKPEHRQKMGNDFGLPGIQRANPTVPHDDLSFYLEPEGLYPVILRAWARYKKPIMITENGVPDRKDDYRQWWIEQTVIAMQRALSEDVPVIGYMHWSLLDNFEWKYGWWPRYGLVEVDRQVDMKRTPRPSAIWFARYLRDLQAGGGQVPPVRPVQQRQPQPAVAEAPKPRTEQPAPLRQRPTAQPRPAPGQPANRPAARPSASSSVLGRLKVTKRRPGTGGSSSLSL